MSFEVFMAVKIQVEFMWSVMPCSVVRYQHFRGPYCLYLQSEVIRLHCAFPFLFNYLLSCSYFLWCVNPLPCTVGLMV